LPAKTGQPSLHRVEGVSHVRGRRESPSSIYKSYFRTLFLSRLALLAFWACFAYFVVWAIPWIPGGLTAGDYSMELVATLVIAGSSMLLGLIAATLRSQARNKREALVAWTAVYDETTGLYNRRYFYERLSLECERSQRHDIPFALALLEMQYPQCRQDRRAVRADRAALRPAAELVKSLTRATDVVALISEREFAVLLVGARHDVAVQLAERLRQSVNARLPSILGAGDPSVWPTVEMGVAAYGEDACTLESLLDAARLALEKSTSDTSTETAA
jgi:diguanylate cyclase (GGDEF)-like protein